MIKERKLDRQRIRRLHNLMKEYGDWIRGGRASEGMFNCPWPDEMTRNTPYKPVRRAVRRKKDKPLVTPHQPHSTRHTPSSKPLRGNLQPVLVNIHAIVMVQPELTKFVVCCVWVRGMGYPDIRATLNISSKKIGILRMDVLKLIENGHIFC
jgi:hypothetical protein